MNERTRKALATVATHMATSQNSLTAQTLKNIGKIPTLSKNLNATFRESRGQHTVRPVPVQLHRRTRMATRATNTLNVKTTDTLSLNALKAYIHAGAGSRSLKKILYKAAYAGRYDLVTYLVDHPLLQRDTDALTTALYLAARSCHVRIATLLLDRGALVDGNIITYTPLMEAAKALSGGKDSDMITLLLSRGANPNIRDTTYGNTALIEFFDVPMFGRATRRRLRNLEALIRATDVHIRTKNNKTVFHIAATQVRSRPLETRLLYRYLPSPAILDTYDSFGNTALLRAATWGDHLGIKAFLEAVPGVNVNKRSQDGRRTPLIEASRQCMPRNVGVLLSFGADPNSGNINGEAPLDFAVGLSDGIRCLKVAKMLLDRGARLERQYPADGPLSIAIENSKKKDPLGLRLVSLLLDHGADPNESLHYAIDAQNLDIFRKLLHHPRTNVNFKVAGETALIQAITSAHLPMAWRRKVIDMLLSRGADVTIKDSRGKSALDYAGSLPNSRLSNRLFAAANNGPSRKRRRL